MASQLEQNYTFWFEGQDEEDGKDILAPSLEAAARMAVDMWRHEHLRELGGKKITVYLRDESGTVRQIKVSQEHHPESRA